MAQHGTLSVAVPGEAQPINIAFSESGNPNGPLLLFIHGLGAWRKVWIDLIKHSSYARIRKQYRCVAIDLPGFGDSGELTGVYDIKSNATVVAGALALLTDEKAVLIGNSLGGSIALVVGIENPGYVRAVVAQGAPISAADFSDGERETLARLRAFTNQYIASTSLSGSVEDLPVKLFNLVLVVNPVREVGFRRLFRSGESVRLFHMARVALQGAKKNDKRAYSEMVLAILNTNNLRDDLHRLTVPLMVVDGYPTFGPVDTLDGINALTDRVPLKRVVRIEGAEHLAPFVEVGQFAEALNRFLDDLKVFETEKE